MGKFDFRGVHPGVEFGTASDRYAGWMGQIYTPGRYEGRITSRRKKLGPRTYEEKVLPVECVEEYFRHFGVLELDFTFIDADKRNYLNYYLKVKEMTRPGGLIILDNVLWSGKVVQPESEIDDILVETNRLIAEDPDVENVFLTVRDGLNVVRKVR